MKICLLAPEFVPVWGGVGTYTRELVRNLPKDYEIHVVTPKRERFGKEENQKLDFDIETEIPDNVHVHYLSSARDTFIYNAQFQYACFKHVPKLLKKERIEIVHSHMAQMPDLLLRLRGHSPPTIVTIHNTIKSQKSALRLSSQPFNCLGESERAVYLLYPALSFLEEIYLTRPKRCIAPSHWMRNDVLRSSHVSQERGKSIGVIPNSIDVNECRRIASFGRDHLQESFGERRVVFYCGRLLAHKGVDLLVGAIPRILREINDNKLFFVLAGAGNSNRYTEKLIELGVRPDRFLFTGSISRTKCLELMGRAELLILPSFLENCPYAILEAMACEVPVVASNVGGIPEIIQNGQNGLTFQCGHSDELSDKVIGLLRNRDLQHKLTQEALKAVSDGFSWSSNLHKYIQAYEATLG